MEAVSAELSDAVSRPNALQGVFGDLRGAQSDVAGCFSDVFDQLETLSLEVFARHKCLQWSAERQAEAGDADRDQHLDQRLEELRQLEAAVRSAHEETARLWTEMSAAGKEILGENKKLQQSRDEMQRLSAELQAALAGMVQDRAESQQFQKNVQEQLQRLAAAAADWSAAQSASSNHDGQLAQLVEASRQQQAAWQQERAALEAELKAERQRAAEQAEAAAEHRRAAAEQQAELAGELKRMRSLLEVLQSNMSAFPGASAAPGAASSASENTALESMLAQFEMLQRDLAQRRAGGNNKEAVKR